MAEEKGRRLSYQEAMDLMRLPSGSTPQGPVQRFMSTRAAFLPGSDLTSDVPRRYKAAYGGNVYAQAGLAACRAWRQLEDEKATEPSERLGLHVCRYLPSLGPHLASTAV